MATIARSIPGTVILIGLSLAAFWGVTWLLGGAGKVPPHWFYLPILFAASRLGRSGALVVALLSGLVAGPLMPLDVSADTPQEVSDWGGRTAFFVVIGLVMAEVVAGHKRAEEARAAHEAELEVLWAIDLSILGVAPFEDTLSIARRALDRLLGADRVGLFLLDADGATIHRTWVSHDEVAHQRDEPVPASGPVGEVLRTGEPLPGGVVPERSSWEGELAEEGLRTFVIAPLMAEGEVLGALAASSTRRQLFRAPEVATLTRIATQVAIALGAGALRSEVERRVRELNGIRNVGEAAGASLELHRVLDAALDRSLEVAGLDMGWVSLVHEHAREPMLIAERNLPEGLRALAARSRLGGSALSDLAADGRPRIIRDVRLLPTAQVVASSEGSRPETASIIAVPLSWEGRVIGMMALGSTDGRIPTERDLALVVELARPIAAAVSNARLYQAVTQLEEQRRALIAELVTAQEEERKRIAGDLHDDAVQVMVAVGMRLELLQRRLENPEHIKVLEKASRVTREAVSRLRHMLFELHPPSLDREGLAAAIRVYLEEHAKETGTEATLEARLDREPPPETRVLLYRVVQEAVTNVRKHSGARRVTIRIEERDGGHYLRVEDDGRGFVAERGEGAYLPGHVGLPMMRERASMAGGWCTIWSAPGKGTTVETWIPGHSMQVGA